MTTKPRPKSHTFHATEVPAMLRPRGLLVVPLKNQPVEGDDGEHHMRVGRRITTTNRTIERTYNRDGELLSEREYLRPLEEWLMPYSPLGGPGDSWVGKERYASPSNHTVAYESGGECGAWLGDGAGGRLWCHHGYIVEAPGYPFGLETLRTWGLKKYGGKWKAANTMPIEYARIHNTNERVELRRVRTITEAEAIAAGFTVSQCADVFEAASKGVKWAYERCHMTSRGGYFDFDFCPECAKICAKPGPWKDRYGQKHTTPPGVEIDGWNESHESDVNKHCDRCGILIHHSLTKYGVDRELMFEDGLRTDCLATCGTDAAILANLAGGIGDLREEHYGRLAQFGFATDFNARYPNAFDRNDYCFFYFWTRVTV